MLMVEKTCYSPEAGGIVSLSYPPKPPKDVDDVRQRVGNDALVSELEQHTKPPPAQPQREPRIRFYRPSELRDYDGSGDSLVGEHHIPRGEVVVVAGEPGVGKSLAATALAVAGATGGSWFGMPVHTRVSEQ